MSLAAPPLTLKFVPCIFRSYLEYTMKPLQVGNCHFQRTSSFLLLRLLLFVFDFLCVGLSFNVGMPLLVCMPPLLVLILFEDLPLSADQLFHHQQI